LYWLRRIPKETRVVVLVVFLALFQAILLSVFGLRAIQWERRTAEEQVHATADGFLHDHVEAPAQIAVYLRAEEVYAAAFEARDAAWAERAPLPGGGLVTAAFTVTADGRILAPDGDPLHRPASLAAADDAAARAAAVALRTAYRTSRLADDEKRRRDLELARRFPFATDEEGHSLGLLFAASALFGPPDPRALLQARWVGLLQRGGGAAPRAAVDAFLQRIDAAGAGDAAFQAGREAQDRVLLPVLQAARLELPRFPRPARAALHASGPAGPDPPFYVRHLRTDGSLQVLAMRREALRELLASVAEEARRAGEARGLGVEIVEGVPSHEDMRDLAGYRAVARIAPGLLREESGRRERFYWYIIGFSVLGMLAGGFLAARLVMREVKLAKLKSGFVSNVTHELKTPLTSIRMFVEMLRSGRVQEEAERRECLDVITQETERLGRLIQRVLDFSRLEARMRRFRWTVGSLRGVVEREAERFRRITGIEPERFLVKIAPDAPAALHDPEAFAEVVSNLLSNAYKFSPPQDRRIRLQLGSAHGLLVLAVEDNGPGVPGKERERIFEPFYRADDYLTRTVEGSGLGLSIVKSIVRAHGGRVVVEDGKGGGGRFVVALPTAPKGRPAQPPAAAEAAL